MPFYIVNTNMGFCGTDETDIIEAGSAEDAITTAHENLAENISASVEAGFDTYEEAENVLEDY